MWPQVINAAVTATNIDHKAGEIVTGQMAVTGWYPGPSIQYSARWNAEKVLKGSPMEEWDPQWNTTWALKDDSWTQVGFEEARRLKAEKRRSNGEEEGKKIEGKGKVWDLG